MLGQGAKVSPCPTQRCPDSSQWMGGFICLTGCPPYPLLWPLCLCALSATLLDRPAGVWSHGAVARFPLSCPQTLKKQEHSTMAHPWLWFGPFPLLPSPALSQRAYGYTPPALWGRPRLKYPAPHICHLLASHMRSKRRLRDRNPDGAHCHTARTWQSWELQPNKGCHLLISGWHTAHCRPSAG